ncbi:MAG: hypothetical protein Q9168_004226 [Polycauliona sp. 1 TL-2023]
MAHWQNAGMDTTVKQHSLTYEAIIEEQDRPIKLGTCIARSDDSGIWNFCKAWYLFPVHLLACVALMVGVIRLQGHEFEIGASPTIWTLGSRLYQSQVTGLISLGLVTIRLIAGSSSVLLAWRIAFVLLEKRGITLAGLTRLINIRVPLLPSKSSSNSLLWSIWATTTVLLLWPQGFAAPLASSSVSWIPGTRVLQEAKSTLVSSFGNLTDWPAIWYVDARMSAVMDAVSLTAKDPTYAFNQAHIPLRRYFNSTQMVPSGSKIDLTMPYFAVTLRWVDASSDDRSKRAGDPQYQDVNTDKGFPIRNEGAIGLIRDEPWDSQAAMPKETSTINDTRFIGIKLGGFKFGDELPDGSHATASTRCQTTSEYFGQLPNVDHYQNTIVEGKKAIAYDCYMFAEATIIAGSIQAKTCTVTASDSSGKSYATCSVERDDKAIEPHWIAGLALDFTSEVLKYTVMQNYSQPWISHDLDDYVSGMLTLGYHAAWSGLMTRLGNDSEPAAFRPASPIVFASIDNTKLYVWLAMQATLTISAVLVLLAQSVSKTKTIRDPTIAALTIDLTDIAHSGRANGLCNATALSKEDAKLPSLRWQEERTKSRGGQAGTDGSSCRKIVFVDEAPRGGIRRRGHFKDQRQAGNIQH